jgi:type IV secretion system protein VirD4
MGIHYLRHDGPEHVMAFAPTRSGKGVGLVIPTLLSWTGSAVIHDIKGENWQLTAGWRGRFSHTLLFNPTDVHSAKYNPLLEVRRGENEIRDVQNIADILVDPEGALERRNHWEKTSHSLLVGAILHVLYAEEEKTLARVATFLSDPQRPFIATLKRMMTTNHLGTKEVPQVHPVVASAAREVLNKSDNERSGVLSTAMSFLGLYRDPTVAAVTSRCDWRIADLVEADHPVSLYFVIPPSDISRTKPLVRLVLNQIGRRLTEKLDGEPGRGRKHQLLLMLDEFPALGRLDFFETSLAFLAGYGVRAFLIAQSLNQIEKAYGEHNSILDNCHVRVAFATNDERTARRISDALGIATEQRAMRNYAGHRLAPWLAHVMVSRQETARPLLTTGEVMQLPPKDELVLISGMPPIRAKKLRYYEDRNFRRRVAPPPPLSDDIYADRPRERGDDWSGLIRVSDSRLGKATEEAKTEDEGGLQQQRHPGLSEEPAKRPEPPRQLDLLGLDRDDADPVADKHAMDRVGTTGTLIRARTIDQGRDHDTVPGF